MSEKEEIRDELASIEGCQRICPRFDLHREQRADYLRKLLNQLPLEESDPSASH